MCESVAVSLATSGRVRRRQASAQCVDMLDRAQYLKVMRDRRFEGAASAQGVDEMANGAIVAGLVVACPVHRQNSGITAFQRQFVSRQHNAAGITFEQQTVAQTRSTAWVGHVSCDMQ